MADNTRMRTWAVAAVIAALGHAPAPAAAQSNGSRIVNCSVDSHGTPPVRGKCRFNPSGGGSFMLESADVRRSLTGPILTVSVQIVRPDVAEVRGLTRDGINSRWGEARRARDDRGCWVGPDFRVCAW